MTFTNPLVPEVVQPRWVKIDYNRGNHETGAPKIEYRECHFYLAAGDATTDLFVIENGRLHRTNSFNEVISIEEVAQPE